MNQRPRKIVNGIVRIRCAKCGVWKREKEEFRVIAETGHPVGKCLKCERRERKYQARYRKAQKAGLPVPPIPLASPEHEAFYRGLVNDFAL